MDRRIRRLNGCLAIAALIGGAVWAWYGLPQTRATPTVGAHSGGAPVRPGGRVRLPPIEPIQFHLIPRDQPTPLSPSSRPPHPQE
jgi:hypothetical protein